MNIFLSPSNQTANIYAYGNTNEHEQCKRIARAAYDYLTQNYSCNVEIAEREWDISRRAEEAKAFEADFYIAIHTNAFNSTVKGVETYYYGGDRRGQSFAAKLLNDMASIGIVKRRTAARTYGELIMPTCARTYVEVDFHSNPERAKWIIENTTLIGERIAKTIVEYFSISPKGIEEEKRCIIVAKSPVLRLEEAEKAKAELTAKGYTVELQDVGAPTDSKKEDKPKEEENKPTAEPKPELKVGDTVKLSPDAVVYGAGYRFSSWVYDRVLYVREIKGDRVVVSTVATGVVTGAVDIKYLIRM